MKKIILGLLVGLMAFGISLKASASARLDSMTADSREVDDIDLIWLYPNKVLDYKNTVDFRMAVDGDFGEGVSEWGGALMEVSPDLGTWGIYVNRPFSETSSIFQTFQGLFTGAFPIYPIPIVGVPQSPTAETFFLEYQNVVDAFWAKDLGGADLGIRFSYGSSFPEIDNLGLSVGLGLPNVGPFARIDFHADFSQIAIDEADTKNDGIYTIREGVLASSDLDQESNLKVFLDMRQDHLKVEEIGGPFVDDLSQFAGDLGLSVGHKVQGGKGLVSTGMIFDYSSINSQNGLFPIVPPFTIDNWILIWNASLEYQVYDWLTIRSGLGKALVVRSFDPEDLQGNGIYYDGVGAPVAFNLGFGINWQNFTLNTNLDVASLENSINGVQPGNGLFFTNGNPIAQAVSADLQYKF